MNILVKNILGMAILAIVFSACNRDNGDEYNEYRENENENNEYSHYYSSDFEYCGAEIKEVGELYAKFSFNIRLRVQEYMAYPYDSLEFGIMYGKNNDFSSSNKIGLNNKYFTDYGDNHYYCDGGTHDNYIMIGGLSPATTYYCRGYVKIYGDTTFTETKQFTTTLEHSYGSFTDERDGNTYRTITLGNQTWMAENLRYLPFLNNNTSIDDKIYQVPGYKGFTEYNGTWTTDIESAKKQMYLSKITSNNYNYYTSNLYESCGVLYNYWASVNQDDPHNSMMGYYNIEGQGVCPDGWHLPTINEWNELINYISSQDEYSCTSSSAWIGNAKSVSVPFLWYYTNYYYCSPGYNTETNNATGFSAYPTTNIEIPDPYRGSTYFGSTYNGTFYYIDYQSSIIEQYSPDNMPSNRLTAGLRSVRCIRN